MDSWPMPELQPVTSASFAGQVETVGDVLGGGVLAEWSNGQLRRATAILRLTHKLSGKRRNRDSGRCLE